MLHPSVSHDQPKERKTTNYVPQVTQQSTKLYDSASNLGDKRGLSDLQYRAKSQVSDPSAERTQTTWDPRHL